MEPAYKTVYDSIRKKITDAEYEVGAIIPAEPELEHEYNVSRTTIRRAIGLLVSDGFLSVRQGRGTQVVSRKAVQYLNRFTSISEALAQKGYHLDLQSCFIEKKRAGEKIAQLLAITATTPVICIHRIKTADGKPICLMENYIPCRLVPNLDLHQPIPDLYPFLKEKYNLQYNSSRDTISACNATFEQAQLLKVEPQTALLNVQRVCYQGTQPCEVDVVKVIADLFEYEVYFGDDISS